MGVLQNNGILIQMPQELHELYKNRFNYDITDYNGKGSLGLHV
jgi:hypothetical protein